MPLDADDLSQAVVLFLGFGIDAWPHYNTGRLLGAFGAARGKELESRVLSLLDELGRIRIDWSVHSLESGSAQAVAEMRSRHPDLSDAALRALDWKFSFDWR